MNNSPLEESEQKAVAEYLDYTRLIWCHVPNERKAKPQYMAKLKTLGVKSGVPDILIFTPPPDGWHYGLAIELKRAKGGVISEAQATWGRRLSECGWYWQVCAGASEAIAKIKEVYRI
jgi:hypothetical protein